MESINNEEKTLIHISHLHPLKLIASPEPKPMCHACNMPCADQSYGCIQCNYFLHITCATTKRSMDHPSHPAHTLKLELTPPYHNGPYGCDGCGVDGSSFCLRCGECSYDLHLPCAAIPHQVKHLSHHHPLILVYKNPYPSHTTFICDLCNNDLDVNKWFYFCKSCDFGTHVGCLSPERTEVLSPGLQEPHHMESMNNVEKTMLHISHLHPLKLIASPEPKPMCHACNMLCSNQSYGCIQCNYFLHIVCATTKRSMDHPSHPAHSLKLELTPPYHNGTCGCDGCGVNSSSFCLRCRECSYDLHLPCAAIPHQVKHHSHPHPLTLVYENPYPPNTEALACDLCMKNLDVNKWFYLCTSCDFGGHVECFSPEKLEVLSPGLQAPHAPPPPQQTQPQPHGTGNAFNEATTLLQHQEQSMDAQVQMMDVQLQTMQTKAEKSLTHISHLHPLELVASPEPKPICYACNLQCGDHSYGCIDCHYFLHVTCATIQNNLLHPAHPAHTLTFELTPTYYAGKFCCSACGEEGNTFSLSCRECDYDLHIHCAALPYKVDHECHCHPLFLFYKHLAPHNPNSVTASCELCPASVDLFKWFYRCIGCNIGGHVACFAQNTVDVFSPGLQAPAPAPVPEPEPAPEEQPGQIGSITVDPYEQANEIMNMQFQMMQVQALANLMAETGRNISSYF